MPPLSQLSGLAGAAQLSGLAGAANGQGQGQAGRPISRGRSTAVRSSSASRGLASDAAAAAVAAAASGSASAPAQPGPLMPSAQEQRQTEAVARGRLGIAHRRSTLVSDADDAFADDADGPAFGVNYVTTGRATRILDPAKGSTLLMAAGGAAGGPVASSTASSSGADGRSGSTGGTVPRAAASKPAAAAQGPFDGVADGDDDRDGDGEGEGEGNFGGLHGPLPGSAPAAVLRHRMSLRTFNSEAAQRLDPHARHGRSSMAIAMPGTGTGQGVVAGPLSSLGSLSSLASVVGGGPGAGGFSLFGDGQQQHRDQQRTMQQLHQHRLNMQRNSIAEASSSGGGDADDASASGAGGDDASGASAFASGRAAALPTALGALGAFLQSAAPAQ